MVNIDWDKIGKFIAELRHEKKMTQQDLSDILYTARENVSKWERGINKPTTETLIKLSEIFEVSVNEILAGERRTINNEKKIENMAINVLDDSRSKIKRILIRFILIIIALFFIFLVYYFINSYNTLYVYKIYGENENFATTDGIVIFSKNKSYLKLGEIEALSEKKYDKVEIYYLTKAKEEVVIYESQGENTTLSSTYGYDEYFSYNRREEIINNSYLRISYQGEEEVLKLTFKRDMHNSFLVFNKEKDVINKDYDSNTDEKIKIVEKYFQDHFQYNQEQKSYTYSENGVKMEYSLESKILVIFENKDNNLNILKYNFKNNCLTYSDLDEKNEITDRYIYNLETKKCLEGTCDQNLINHFKVNYYDKYVQ